jgi:2-pyrone-4,6-dicarboxylate lactonase
MSSSTSKRRTSPSGGTFLTSLPTIVVVDHMGRPDVTKPVDGP